MMPQKESTIKVIIRLTVMLAFFLTLLTIVGRVFLHDSPLFANIQHDLRIAQHNFDLQKTFADEYQLTKLRCKVGLKAEEAGRTLTLIFINQSVFSELTKAEIHEQSHVFAQFAKLKYDSIQDVDRITVRVERDGKDTGRPPVSYRWSWSLGEL